jgi:dephospho-CoA kinase
MKVVGLCGGVASGKSTVAQELESLGAVVLDADRAAHAVLAEPEVIAAATDRWGPGVLDSAGQLDRKQLAERVFRGETAAEERAFLESLVHPRVRAQLHARLEELRTNLGVAVVVLDVPLLLENGYAPLCDEIWFVDTSDEQRAHQARGRGLQHDQWTSREESQMPLILKRERSTRIIRNSGNRQSLASEVASAWHSLLRIEGEVEP